MFAKSLIIPPGESFQFNGREYVVGSEGIVEVDDPEFEGMLLATGSGFERYRPPSSGSKPESGEAPVPPVKKTPARKKKKE